MGWLKEFKTFAMKGNVLDLAIGVIVGASFGKIVTSLVTDIITPPLGILVGGVNFTGLKVTLQEATAAAPAVTLNYGSFLQNIFDFLIVAFAIFFCVKAINRMQFMKSLETPAAAKPEVELLTEIRDLLKKS